MVDKQNDGMGKMMTMMVFFIWAYVVYIVDRYCDEHRDYDFDEDQDEDATL